MRDENVIRQSNYVEFSFNGGTSIINFDNFEILGDLQYVPKFTTETQVSESGKSFSLRRPQQEYFEFTLDYDTTATRKKIEQARNLMEAGYLLSFKVANFPTIFTGFEFGDNIPVDAEPEVVQTEVVFGNAVVEFPDDFSFDRGARGEGMTIVEGITVRVYRSTALPVPASECSLVSISDFALDPWNVDGGTNELIGITVEADAGGLIDTIDGRPDGTVTYISGGSGMGSTSAVLTWNAGQSRYEPATGPFILDGIYTAVINNIPVTLNSGQECTPTFQQSLEYTLNTPPEAQSVTISGDAQQGQSLSLSWTYFDTQGDLEDTTPIDREVWFAFPTLTEANNEDLTNAIQLYSGSAYTIGAGIVGYYIRARVIPYALTGDSPGTEEWSNLIGPIATNIDAFSIDTTKNGTFDLETNWASADTVGIDWGDGTFETFAQPTGANTFSHVYSSGAKTITVYTGFGSVNQIKIPGMDVTGVDVLNLTALSVFFIYSNAALTSLSLPASTYTDIRFHACAITSFSAASGTVWNNASLYFYANPITTISLSGTSGSIKVFWGENITSYSGSIDFSSVDAGVSAGQFRISNASGLTDISHKVSPAGLQYRYWVTNCGLTGTHTVPFDFDPGLNCSIRVRQHSSLTGLIFSGTGTTISEFEVYENDLTGSITVPFDFADGASVSFRNNPNLTEIVHGTGLSGVLGMYVLRDCDIGFHSMGGLTFQATATVSLEGNGFSATETNQWLDALDPTSGGLLPVSGSGTIDISGSNAAPDGSSGGIDGITAASNISAAGYTLITS